MRGYLRGFFVFVIVGTIVLLNSTCDDYYQSPCKLNGFDTLYYNLSSDTALIPYTGTDSLVFKVSTANDTDTITFIGQGKKYYYNYSVDYDALPCMEVYYHQGYKISFVEQNKEDSILFHLFLHNEEYSVFSVIYEDNEYTNVTHMTINDLNYGGYLGHVTYDNMFFTGVSCSERNNEYLYINSNNGIIRLELIDKTLQLIRVC